jgi:hypothetical protein
MPTCSSLRIDTQNLALGSDSAEVRALASVVSALCGKIEELERDLRELRLATRSVPRYQPDRPAEVLAYRDKPR